MFPETLWPMLHCPPHQSHMEMVPAGKRHSMLDFGAIGSEICPLSKAEDVLTMKIRKLRAIPLTQNRHTDAKYR